MGELWNTLIDGMGAVLAFLYSIIPNYGLAIIGLTVVVRLVLFPLTAKQARSMHKMQQLQPEIKKLQAQYKNDRQKAHRETAKFYKKNQVSPAAGCLPLLFQMPVFVALFRVLSAPHKHLPTDSKLFRAFCGDLSSQACGSAPGYPKGLSFLRLDLGKAASSVTGSAMDALPYFLLIALVVATSYLQFKQTQSRQQSQANPQAALIGKIFPAMFALISYRLPSGVVLYFLVSNGWQIGQQAIIFRTMPSPVTGGSGAVPASGSEPGAAGKGAAVNPRAPEPEPRPEGWFQRAVGQARGAGEGGGHSGGGGDSQAKPGPKRPTPTRAGRPSGERGLGRAQPSGSQPRPKKRRR